MRASSCDALRRPCDRIRHPNEGCSSGANDCGDDQKDAPTWLEAAARASTAVNRAIIWCEHTDCRSGTCGRRHAMRSGDPAIESVTPRLLVWRKRLATIGGRADVALSRQPHARQRRSIGRYYGANIPTAGRERTGVFMRCAQATLRDRIRHPEVVRVARATGDDRRTRLRGSRQPHARQRRSIGR